ncbi:DUF6252 family protein [Sinomicrobium sp. M5D2P9]
MNRLFHISFITALTIILLLFACNTDDEDENSPKYPEQYITAQVNDTIFESYPAGDVKVYYSEYRGEVLRRALHISAKNLRGNILKLDITDYDDSGTYTFFPDDNYTNSCRYVKSNRSDSPYWPTNVPEGSGSITIRMLENGYAEGTFSFTAYNEKQENKKIAVKNGKFLVKIPGMP